MQVPLSKILLMILITLGVVGFGTLLIFVGAAGVDAAKAILNGFKTPLSQVTLSQNSKEPQWTRLPLYLGAGFMIFSWLLLVLGHIGELRLPWITTLLILATLVGFYKGHEATLGFKSLWHSLQTGFSQCPWLLSFLLVFILLRSFEAHLPQKDGDPLYYHLASAWKYSELEKFDFIPWSPWFLQGGMAESLYTLVALLTGDKISMMLFCQLLHFLFGFPASLLITAALLKKQKHSTSLTLIAMTAAFTFAAGSNALVSAKNDGFVLFFILLSYQKLDLGTANPSNILPRLFVSLFLASFALSIKLTAAFYLMALLFTVVTMLWNPLWREPLQEFIYKKTTPRNWLTLCSVLILCLVVGSPFLIRNTFLTSNPFFPALPHLFASPEMNPRLVAIVQGFTKAPGTPLQIIIDQLEKTVFSKAFFPILVLGFFIQAQRPLWTLILASITLIGLVTGRGLYPRFVLFVYPLMAMLAAEMWHHVSLALIHKKPTLSRFKSQGLFALFVLALINGQMEVTLIHATKNFVPFVFSQKTYNDYLREIKPNFSMHQWINANSVKGPILSFGDNECFFLDPPLSVPENHRLASEIVYKHTMPDFANAFDQAGFAYVLVPKEPLFDYAPRWLMNPQWQKYFRLIYESPEGYKLFARTFNP